MAATPVLQFMPLSSAVDATFWHELGERKVARYRLDATSKRVTATYRTGFDATQAPRVALAADAFAMTDAGVDVPTYAAEHAARTPARPPYRPTRPPARLHPRSPGRPPARPPESSPARPPESSPARPPESSPTRPPESSLAQRPPIH